MNKDFFEYMGIIALLIFVYLVVNPKNFAGSTQIIGALSNANTSMIRALQGN